MIQKTGSIHVYFQRNKGHLAGVILCSILVGMGETMWAFVFQKIEADQYTAEEGCVRCSAGSGYDPVYEQQQWDVSLNTE